MSSIVEGYPCVVCGKQYPTYKGRGIHEWMSHPGEVAAIHAERKKDKNRRYRLRHPDSAASVRRWAKEHPERMRELDRQSRARHQPQILARRALGFAIRYGRMVKQPCETCGDPVAEGHHAWGYEPANHLRVTWLCKAHHEAVHHPELQRVKAELRATARRLEAKAALTLWDAA